MTWFLKRGDWGGPTEWEIWDRDPDGPEASEAVCLADFVREQDARDVIEARAALERERRLADGLAAALERTEWAAGDDCDQCGNCWRPSHDSRGHESNCDTRAALKAWREARAGGES